MEVGGMAPWMIMSLYKQVLPFTSMIISGPVMISPKVEKPCGTVEL